ncbi:MAG: APC family permease [Ferruginibacter sp.]
MTIHNAMEGAAKTGTYTEKKLRSGALGLGDVFMQAITHTAPATAILFTIPFITFRAGVAAPISYLFAFLLILVLGVTMIQLARHLPSAGGYYTYISHTISPRAGFLTSWLYFLYDPTIAGYSLAFVGAVTEESLRVNYGVYFPWWLFLLVTGSFVSIACYRGIEISAKLLVVLGATEIIIVLALSCWSLVDPGDGGVNVQSFHPSNAPSIGGLAMGVVFSIFALTGWEGVAPLAEESKDPKRTLPKAIMYSIIAMGIFLVFCSWSILIGWGTDHIDSFVAAQENPAFILARKFWGNGWVIVLFALINSMLAVAIACNNSATRVWFAMARSGSMPSLLAKIHPKFQTPQNAVYLQTILMFTVGWGLGYLVGPKMEFDFMGVVITFTLAIIYTMGNIGVMRYYRKEKRHEYNVVLHTIFPVAGIAVLCLVVFFSLTPWPEKPIGYAFWVVLVWLLLGVVVLLVMKWSKREGWTKNAGTATVHSAEEINYANESL